MLICGAGGAGRGRGRFMACHHAATMYFMYTALCGICVRAQKRHATEYCQYGTDLGMNSNGEFVKINLVQENLFFK